MDEYERGELIGLSLIVAWLIDQSGQSATFDSRFGVAGLDALLQKVDGGVNNVPLSNGIRSAIRQTLAWKKLLECTTSHDTPST